ncbi:IQ domain-containing protein F5-like [Eptesicus fuscus]|uniref:IQ domain-containing protein F5-like n=1 Tax=Eptesicus fuscus TaxID=29078 RepID=UPI002403CB5A|nr:IQ domain-containing protein F5-like [Eptesicus fuscus]
MKVWDPDVALSPGCRSVCWERGVVTRGQYGPRFRQKRRRVMLEDYTGRKWAVVRLQSWFRMWRIRLRYRRLLQATRIIQMYWRYHNCHTNGFLQGRYELTANQLGLELEIFLGSQICRITECIPFPIKN